MTGGGFYKKLRWASILLSLLIFTVSCSRSNSIVLSGSIESTQIDVASEAGGKIIQLDKEEGTRVKKGDVLATVDSALQEQSVKQAEAVVRLKQAKLDEVMAGTRNEQIRQAEANVESARAAVNSARTSVDNAQINYNYLVDKYNKAKTLSEAGASAQNDLTDAQYRMDTANQQLLSLQKQLQSYQSQLQASQAQLDLLVKGSTDQTIQAARADLEQSQASLEQARILLSKYQVKSPVDGTYLMKNVNIGDIVNTGTSVGTISDLTDLWVKVYLPQKHLSLVHLDQEISLRSPALAGQAIKGRIIFISDEAEYTPKNVETSEAKENTVFKIKIKITDPIDKLKPGMTVDAVIQ